MVTQADLTPWIYVLAAGGLGGLAYDYYYKLLTMATWMQAVSHVGAGALAAILTVLSGALSSPTSYGTFLLLAGTGYAGTDVIDSCVQKLQQAPAAKPAGG